MATKDESKDSKSTKSATNPTDEAILAKGEATGKARGPDEDATFHVYEFEDPQAS